MSKPEPARFPLDDFFETLLSHGFYLGVDTHLRLQEYLNWFVQKTDQGLDTLKYQLAALLCQNADEQGRFYNLFDQNIAPLFSVGQAKVSDETSKKRPDETQKAETKKEIAEQEVAPAVSGARSTRPVLTEGKSGPVRVELKFPSNDLRIWNLAEVDLAVRPLREKEWATVLEWDIAATIRSTIRAGGMPTFELRRRKRAPQYLLLIDQRGPRDHLAGLYAELAAELNRRDVDAEYFFYDRIPSRCWKDRRDYGSYTNIESLQSQFTGSRLLIIGEPEGLLELPRLRPSNLAADLRDAWPQMALLCTRPTAEWGNAELALCQLFPVAPANAAGLTSLTLQWAATEVYAPQYWKIKCPEATVPPVRVARPQEAEPVLENLRYYLGRDGFHWLCAAALYPELYYELTALLHDESIPPPPGLPPGDWDMNRVWWSALLRLSRLDWFRRGSIPLPAREQLRQYFEQHVPAEQRGKVWEQLVQLLEITSPPPGSFAADSLQVTLDWYKTEHQMADPLLTEVARQQLGAALQEKMQSAAINDPLARRVLQKPSQGIATDHPLFIGQVTADVIDIRSGPSASDPVIGQLQKNTRVDIFVFSNDRNWYRIGENWWVSAHSVKTEQIFRRKIETLLQKGRVTAKSLNIRPGPSASDPVIGRLEQNAQVNIFEISNDRNWYRIGENWWVGAQYVEIEQASTPERGGPFRVLWVDDHPEKINNERIQLEQRSDIILTILTETEEAFRKLADERFDLVISDAGRGEDHAAGLKLLRGMRERKINTPFIVYTSATNFDYFKKEFTKAGAAGVFQEEEELMGFIEKLIKKTQLEAVLAPDNVVGSIRSEQEPEKQTKVFISYVNEDRFYKDELVSWLRPLGQTYQFELWHDSQISLGENWEIAIKENLETAEVVILLVSTALLSSVYFKQEIDHLLEKQEQEEVLLLPVLLSEYPRDSTPLSKFLFANNEPVIKYSDRDKAWFQITERIIISIVNRQNKKLPGSRQSQMRRNLVSSQLSIQLADIKRLKEKQEKENNETGGEETIDLQMQKLLWTSLEDLDDISARVYSLLKTFKINTIADLVQFRPEELLKFRGFGDKALFEVEAILQKRGLSLGTDIKENIQKNEEIELSKKLKGEARNKYLSSRLIFTKMLKFRKTIEKTEPENHEIKSFLLNLSEILKDNEQDLGESELFVNNVVQDIKLLRKIWVKDRNLSSNKKMQALYSEIQSLSQFILRSQQNDHIDGHYFTNIYRLGMLLEDFAQMFDDDTIKKSSRKSTKTK